MSPAFELAIVLGRICARIDAQAADAKFAITMECAVLRHRISRMSGQRARRIEERLIKRCA